MHTFPEVDVEEFENLLETEEFNRQLEKLPNVSKRTLVEEKDLGGGKRHTVVRYEARAVPEQVKKWLGDESIGWTEEMDFNRNTHFHKFRIIPTRMKDRVNCEGSYKIEPLSPDGGARRIVTLNVKVKMLGLGSIAERAAKPFLDANAREEERLAKEYIRDHPPEKKGKSGEKKGKKTGK